jgi:hypothetical protein
VGARLDCSTSEVGACFGSMWCVVTEIVCLHCNTLLFVVLLGKATSADLSVMLPQGGRMHCRSLFNTAAAVSNNSSSGGWAAAAAVVVVHIHAIPCTAAAAAAAAQCALRCCCGSHCQQ